MLVDVLCVQNYDYVMSVLLIEVCIHIIMDLHQVDYHTVSHHHLMYVCIRSYLANTLHITLHTIPLPACS